MFRSSSGACALLLFNGQLRSTSATSQQLIAVSERLYTASASPALAVGVGLPL